MPAELVAAYFFEEGTFAFYATEFAVRLVTTYAITSLILKNQQQAAQQGIEIQLGPATDNKLPVVYGERFCKPIVTDAIISTDQKTMWYVLSLSEAPTYGEFTVGEVYYDGKLLIFDPNNPSEITGWYQQPKKHSKVGGTYNTKPAGKLSMWFYRNGSLLIGTQHQTYTMTSDQRDADIASTSTGSTLISAIDVLSDSAIPLSTQWTAARTTSTAVVANTVEDIAAGDTVIFVDSVSGILYGAEITNHPDVFGTSNSVVAVNSDAGSFTIAQPALTSLTAPAAIDLTNSTISGNLMNNATFAIIRLQYDQNSGIYGLGGMDIKLRNPQTQLPGYAIYDYLTNDTYGCGVDPANINIDSLVFLDTISTATLSIVDTAGTTVTNSFTYQVNGIVDTTQDCLTNLNNLTDACDSWLQWDERLGQWGVKMNLSLEQSGGSTATMRVITSDHIIGGINLTPTDLKTSANKITVAFPNSDIINQTDYRYYFLKDDRPELISPNEPDNNIDINMPFVTDSIQATYLGYRKLFMSREDVVINFSMDYSGIGIQAGEIIAVNHEWYGWVPGQYNNGYYPGKPFRVTQVKESKDASGFLGVQVVASSYNDSIYTTVNPHFYTPDQFGINQDPHNIQTPDAPYRIGDAVYETVPLNGYVNSMEIWASTTTNVADYQYISNVSQGPNTFLTPGSVVSWSLLQYPSYTGYVIARAVGPTTYSDFSTPYAITYVSPNAQTTGTVQNSTSTDSVFIHNADEIYSEQFLAFSRNVAGYSPMAASETIYYDANQAVVYLPGVGTNGTITAYSTATFADVSNAWSYYDVGAQVDFPNFGGLLGINTVYVGTSTDQSGNLALWLCGNQSATRVGDSSADTGMDGTVTYNSTITGYTWTNTGTTGTGAVFLAFKTAGLG